MGQEEQPSKRVFKISEDGKNESTQEKKEGEASWNQELLRSQIKRRERQISFNFVLNEALC